MKVAFIFPGQGAQYVGMGEDFYDKFPIAREVFQEADEILGFGLKDLMFAGPADELMQTKNSQAAIYVMSMAVLAVICEQMPDLIPSVCAGLSLGEYTALSASDRLDFTSGVRLVRARGEYMQEACEQTPGTMAAVLGLDEAVVISALEGIEGVWVANLNCPKQVVISGTKEGVENGSAILKEKGARRILPLDVSGAFHSGLMKEAQDLLGKKIAKTEMRDSQVKLVMNVPGDYVSDLDEIRKNMENQVTSPVRWERGIRQMEGIDLFVEIGCGKTLSGMNKKIGVSARTISIDKVSDLEILEKEFGTNKSCL
jgi:[acyl-carrier-protein] S-malonyltransferase